LSVYFIIISGGYFQKDNNVPVFTVHTREPGESISFIHDRMPMILGKENVKNWMDKNADP
jgi:putative SOS response-associated peptidase YedK